MKPKPLLNPIEQLARRRVRRLFIAVGMALVVMATVFSINQSTNEVMLINNRAEPVTFETSVVAYPIRDGAVDDLSVEMKGRDVLMTTTEVPAHSKSTLSFPRGKKEILRVSTVVRNEGGPRGQILTRVSWGLRLRFIQGDGFELASEPASSALRRWFEHYRKWIPFVAG